MTPFPFLMDDSVEEWQEVQVRRAVELYLNVFLGNEARGAKQETLGSRLEDGARIMVDGDQKAAGIAFPEPCGRIMELAEF